MELSEHNWANRVFSHDVTVAILVSQNNKTAAMLVSQTNPVGVELFSYVNLSFVPINLHRCWPRGHVSENILHLRDNLPRNASFWQVGLLDVVLSGYPDKSHNFTNLFSPTIAKI